MDDVLVLVQLIVDINRPTVLLNLTYCQRVPSNCIELLRTSCISGYSKPRHYMLRLLASMCLAYH